MKKITFLFLITLVHSSLNAQFRGEDTYKIYHSITGKFMTVDAENGNMVSADEIPNDDASQIFEVKSVGSNGYFNISCTVEGLDAVRAHSINVFPTNTATPTSETNNTRIFAIEADSENTMQDGYTLRYIHTAQTTTGRYMYDKGADMEGITDGNYPDSDVIYTGGAEDKAKWIFLSMTNPLSTKSFDAKLITITNPISNEMIIKGLSDSVKTIEVFNMLGKSLINKALNGNTTAVLNTSSISSGMYIVRFSGRSTSFTKKIVKN